LQRSTIAVRRLTPLQTASATFFDAPDAFKAMIPHEFGHLYSAGCGFTNFKAGVPVR
jgi:hypothetical protein